MPYYGDNTMFILYYYIYSQCMVELLPIITSASAYIQNKCHLLLTCDWLQYLCYIGRASHNSPIIIISTIMYPHLNSILSHYELKPPTTFMSLCKPLLMNIIFYACSVICKFIFITCSYHIVTPHHIVTAPNCEIFLCTLSSNITLL